MSFILDALKKSESDRQRQSGPSLFEVKVAPPRRRLPIWAVAIAVLLGINAVVISWMLLRRAPAQQPAAAAAPAAAPAPVAPAPVSRTNTTPAAGQAGGPAVAAAAPAPESTHAPQAGTGTAAAGGAPAAMPAPPAGSTDQSAAQASSDANPSDYAPAVEPAPAQGSGTSGTSGGQTGDLPLYQQIVTSADLPALHLDLHVFAASPKDRFAMINMTKVVEGDSLPNGVQVEAIRPDGVVLSYHGTRFLLPRN